MQIPLDAQTIEAIIAGIALILMVASELVLSYHGRATFMMSRERLKTVASAFSAVFLFTVLIRVLQMMNL
jgi:hypothetical protein